MIYLDTYNEVMFHTKEKCVLNLRRTFIEDFSFHRVFYNHDDYVKEILQNFVDDNDEIENAFQKIKQLTQKECDKFITTYFKETNEEDEETLLYNEYIWGD